MVSVSKVSGRKMLLEELIMPRSTRKNPPRLQVQPENEYLNGSSRE